MSDRDKAPLDQTLVCSEARFKPAPSLFPLSLLSTMSGPSQYVPQKEVAASYRPKSYVSLPPTFS